MPTYLYSGEEEFNIENAVQELREQLLDPNWAALNHKILNEPELAELIEILQTIPMVFGNLLIEVKSTSLFLRGSKKPAGSDKLIDRLISILENLNENIHLVFI